MLRKTITTLALASATLTGAVLAAPAQAAVGHCITGPSGGEKLCLNSWNHNKAENFTTYGFTISGPPPTTGSTRAASPVPLPSGTPAATGSPWTVTTRPRSASPRAPPSGAAARRSRIAHA